MLGQICHEGKHGIRAKEHKQEMRSGRKVKLGLKMGRQTSG